MFSILNILGALPWRLIAVGGGAAALFIGGCQFGENRITARWDAQKAATAQVVAKQTEQVAVVNAQESIINQEISNEFQKTKAAIAVNNHSLLDRVPRRVRVDAPSGDSTVPSVPEPAARVDAATTNVVPSAEQSTSNATCEKLAADAAQTTLMVVEFQRWHQEQTTAFGMPTK